MNSFFFESPYILGAISLLIVAIAWYGWLQSLQKLAFVIATVLTILSILLLTANLLVVTDSESIKSTILKTASELDQGNLSAIKDIIAPDSSEAVQAALLMLNRVKIHEARVTRLHAIDVDKTNGIKTAQVRMNVYVDCDLNNYRVRAPRWILLDMEELNGQWKVVHWEHRDPHNEFIQRDAH